MQPIRLIALFSLQVVCYSMCGTLIAGDSPYYEIHGYGTQTEGGLSGEVIRVTNLDNYGDGSLRQAIGTPGARLVVFEVGGVIDLEMNNISVSNPYLTVAGQTAPAPGITLIKGGLTVRTHDVVIQHLAVRPGDAGQLPQSGWEPDAIATSGNEAYNVVFDHCSATWAVDENLSVSGPGDSEPMASSHDVTLYRCIIAECLSYSTHSKGQHSMGTLLHDGVANVSIIGCLYAHNNARNPYYKGNSRAVVVNNVVYNSGHNCVHMSDYGTNSAVIIGKSYGALVGNVWIKGVDSSTDIFVRATKSRACGEAYLEDNILKDRTGADMEAVDSYIQVVDSPPLWPEGLVARPAVEAVFSVLKSAGARAGDRDAIDARIVQAAINGTGEIIDSQGEVGGYPSYTMTTRSIEVPEGTEARRAWLDSLSAAIDTDDALDTSPLNPVLGTISVSERQIPQEYGLALTNYPNPFNPVTRIDYTVSRPGYVLLTVFSLTGQEIATLVDKRQQAGRYHIYFQASGLPSGVYFYQLRVGDAVITKKMTILK
ncbi:MAG: T9SS type A sorting domain-containing protein [Candidatus Neomarinimicrobiota bacterium]